MLEKWILIELGGLIDPNLTLQNHNKMTGVNDLNQLQSRVYYFGLQFLREDFPMDNFFIS